MNKINQDLSLDPKRNKQYVSFIEKQQKKSMTVKDIARFGYKLMRQGNLSHHFVGDNSLFKNALYLAFFVMQLPYEYDNADLLNKIITPKETLDILALFEKRIRDRIPVEYITHEVYYLGNKFYVDKNVLVPRSLMSTQFKDFLEKVQWENHRVLDLCTGSGCIGISLALMNPTIKVDLADISIDALKVAEVNVDHYHLNDRIRCIQSDLFENISDKYDLIITNPPYVPTGEYLAQPDEIKNEPKIALEAGVDGLDIINGILAQSKAHLNQNGLLIAEVGYTAAKHLKKRYRSKFSWTKSRPMNGKECFIDKLIRLSGYLDSILLCKAKDLP